MKKKLFRNRAAWRTWLQENHDTASELWLVYYKKNASKTSVLQPEAVEEALCFGWIDSKVKRIDEERYMQRYTPRKPKSIWSAVNKKRVAKLIEQGLMTDIGMAVIEAAKQDGSWNRLDSIEENPEIPDGLAEALANNTEASIFFDALAPSHKKQYLWWILSAKREATREKRIQETVRRLAQHIKPGI